MDSATTNDAAAAPPSTSPITTQAAAPAASPTSATASGAEELKGPRGLEAGEEALGRWARFVESCFAFKSPPPSHHHFLRRLNQDPHSGGAHRPDMIRIVEDGQGAIVAAARICLRQLQEPEAADNAPPLWAVGIAEVCVSPDHRGKGLAKKVVADALRHAATQRPEARVSLLHCQPKLLPIYQAMGYASHPVPWRRLALPRTAARAAACAEALRAAGRYGATALSTSADLDEVAELHAATPQAHRGVIRRLGAYFEFWIQGELSALPRSPPPVWGVRDAAGRLVAYAVFRCPPFSPGGDELVVLDFGCGPAEQSRARLFLRALALAAARDCPEPGGVRAVRCPAAALPAAAGLEEEGGEEEVVAGDPGWMYRSLGESAEYKRLRACADEGRHLLWPIDHF